MVYAWYIHGIYLGYTIVHNLINFSNFNILTFKNIKYLRSV
jgi:hypothetical protein